MDKNQNNIIAHISNRGDVVQKSALNYYREITEDGYVYSIDMVRIKFKIKEPKLVEKVMQDIRNKSIYVSPTPFEYEYIERKAWFKYRHNLNIKLACGNSFYLAFSMNCDDKAKLSEGVIEFNPNKLYGQQNVCFKEKTVTEENVDIDLLFQGDIMDYFIKYLIGNNSKWIKLVRYDLAIDIPYPKEQVCLIKDNRTYSMYAPSQNPNSYTEYLGKHQSSGFVKVYNKTIESNLAKDITRLEITSEHKDYKKFISQFPEVYVRGNSTLKPYTELNGTDLVLFELLIKEDNIPMYFKRLGRNKQEKLKKYLFEDEYDKRITITERIFNELYKRMLFLA